MSRHDFLNPGDLPPASGFSHGALTGEGVTLYIAGQTGHHHDLTIDDGLVDQFAQACRSVARVIAEAGGEPADLVSLTIYTTDVQEYRDRLAPIGAAYREVFGKHFPPMALIGIAELFDPRAVVELVGVAVVPRPGR
ncbi:MAG TPA: RidA family protein [Acidimicrobiia bacterium]|nr:RidA family protein [Acidimicrobiia bacterium]